MVGSKRRLILAAGSVALTALALWGYWVARPIPFDEARWKSPSWPWDRWRMVADLQAKLENTQPSFDETIQMLEGAPEKRWTYRNQHLEGARTTGILPYELGKPFPLVGRGNDRTLLVGFDADGRVRDTEVREEDGF